jgi:hypothetical protein
MRRLAILCLITLSLAAPAGAASIDPNRIAAIEEAANAFLARAAEARKSGQVPRQSDPDVGALLDTVFDTSDLSHGPVPYADLGKLDDWLARIVLARIVKVGSVYVAAARGVHDFGLFGIEIGRFFDASVAVQRAIADCVMAELDAHPDEKPSPTDLRKLTQLRGAISGALER